MNWEKFLTLSKRGKQFNEMLHLLSHEVYLWPIPFRKSPALHSIEALLVISFATWATGWNFCHLSVERTSAQPLVILLTTGILKTLPTVYRVIKMRTEKQSCLERSMTPSKLVRLSLVQSVLIIAMQLKVQHTHPVTLTAPPPQTHPDSGSRIKTNTSKAALGSWVCVCREQGDTEAALCWGPFSKLSLFNVSLKQTPHPLSLFSRLQIGKWPGDLGGSCLS